MKRTRKPAKKILFEELRLIERTETEVNSAWKGAHLLLFFLAFVFGSFCTFCFHVLMYIFEEKCVLFPKLLSLTSLRHNVIYEFIPEDKDKDTLPVDFVSTQWVEKSACYLPTYVPLISGIFGLVWTTMFLMCTSGSRTLTGLRRPWRVIPPVFIFSVAMGALCIYSSTVTQYGLDELCSKLGEITGSSTCSYTVNVVTLLYERRIRGVYQATRLTILSAWLHTICWVLSALLALIRVLLVVDFQLVKVNVELVGDIDKMLERNEEHLRTVSPNLSTDEKYKQKVMIDSTTEIHFQNDSFDTESLAYDRSQLTEGSELLFMSDHAPHGSMLSLVPDEERRLARLKAYNVVPKQKQFIVKMLYDIIDNINLIESSSGSESSAVEIDSDSPMLTRQYGQQKISSSDFTSYESTDNDEPGSKKKQLIELKADTPSVDPESMPGSPENKERNNDFESVMNLTADMRRSLKYNELPVRTDNKEPRSVQKKSNLKNIAVQTDKKSKKRIKQKVKISESRSKLVKHESNTSTSSQVNRQPQKPPKEKQD